LKWRTEDKKGEEVEEREESNRGTKEKFFEE
jgi:hypothetical protein